MVSQLNITDQFQADQINQIIHKMNLAQNIDELFEDAHEPVLSLVQGDRITLYTLDQGKKTINSRFKVGDDIKQIRLPMDKNSVVGYVATTGGIISIMDAYNDIELMAIYPDLKFDCSWDRLSGYHTRQILAAPIIQKGKLTGVIQVINKRVGQSFTSSDRKTIHKIGGAFGAALQNICDRNQKYRGKFDYLILRKIISTELFEQAKEIAWKRKESVENVLVNDFGVRLSDIGHSISAFHGVQYFSCDNSFDPPTTLLNHLKMKHPFRFMEHNRWAPFREEGGVLHILCENPSDRQKVEDIRQVVNDKKFKLFYGSAVDIHLIISRLSGEKPKIDLKMEETLTISPDEDQSSEIQPTPYLPEEKQEDDKGVIKLVNDIIIDAYETDTSDIHVETYPGNHKTVIRFRQDGVCIDKAKISPRLKRAIIARIKIMANLNIAEHRLPQDGKIQFNSRNQKLELRVATLPTYGGNEDAVLRILAASKPLPLDKLNLNPGNQKSFTRAVKKPYGIFLVVGPTGSGKTTTLHSALGHINTSERKIWTAEDPVEITQEGLRQMQMRPDINLTFATAMRSFLRADPDVIMIGEIRDSETAGISVEASLTGHMVFSTMHTNSAPETVTRLIDFGIDPFNFADALVGVLAQRLVRTLCPDCKKPHVPTETELALLAKEYGEKWWPELAGTVTANLMSRAVGCPKCNNTGYRGRTGIHEILIMNPETKELIQSRAPVEKIRSSAVRNGMRTLKQDGIWKCLKGDTDISQVRSVCAV